MIDGLSPAVDRRAELNASPCGATAVLAFRTPVLGRAVGWWAVAFMAMVIVTMAVVPMAGLDMATMTAVLGMPFMVTLFGWMVSLARELARAQPTSRRTR